MTESHTISSRIRAAMSTETDMSHQELVAVTGLPGEQVSTFLACAERRRGEVIKTGKRGSYRFRLNPDWKPVRKLPADYLEESKVKRKLSELLEAGTILRTIIKECVDYEEDADLTKALTLHESLEQSVREML